MLRRILYTFIFVMFISFAVSAQGKIERPSSSSKSAKTTGTLNGHNYVDLGLPSGTKWATCNIGTDKFDYYGDYFVWGNPRVITNDNVSWNLRPQYYGQSSFSGLAEYDPARALWGGRWQTPSKEAFEELVEYCTFTWTDEYDGGVWAQSKRNGEKIYFPASGGCSGTQGYDYAGIVGLYWTSISAPTESTYGDKITDFAFCFQLTQSDSSLCKIRTEPRQACLSIRPILQNRD